MVFENGEPLPAGAQLQIIRDNILENELFPTGMGGEVYLTGLEAENRLRVIWKEQSCEFALLSRKRLTHCRTLGLIYALG